MKAQLYRVTGYGNPKDGSHGGYRTTYAKLIAATTVSDAEAAYLSLMRDGAIVYSVGHCGTIENITDAAYEIMNANRKELGVVV